jgi:hypothetical protein
VALPGPSARNDCTPVCRRSSVAITLDRTHPRSRSCPSDSGLPSRRRLTAWPDPSRRHRALLRVFFRPVQRGVRCERSSCERRETSVGATTRSSEPGYAERFVGPKPGGRFQIRSLARAARRDARGACVAPAPGMIAQQNFVADRTARGLPGQAQVALPSRGSIRPPGVTVMAAINPAADIAAMAFRTPPLGNAAAT